MNKTRPALDSTRFGPFVLLEIIGQGATGTLYKARGPKWDGPVALKIARGSSGGDAGLLGESRRKSTLPSIPRHPSLVRELARGEEDGLPYRVMEYVPGRSLADRVHEQGPIPMAEAVGMFTLILQAVALLHKHDFVHRDIKPASVLFHAVDGPKLSDMGLVQDLAAAPLFTPVRFRLGSMEFVAPELFDDASCVDARSDIYALAATLYVALTGRAIFGPGNLGTVLTRKLNHQLTPLAQLVPEVGVTLDRAVTLALHPELEMRPASVTDLLAALEDTDAHVPAITVEASAETSQAVEARRSSTRYPIDMVTSCQVFGLDRELLCQARMLDISTGGVCLELSKRFEPSTKLQITLPGKPTGQEPLYPVVARWIKQLSNGNWMLGCAFSHPLEERELERLLAR